MSTHAEEIRTRRARAPSTFAKVWIVLLVMTGVEVFWPTSRCRPLIMLTVLLGLSIIKAALIIAYFMHLKFEGSACS